MRRSAILIASASVAAGACSPTIPARFTGKDQQRIVAAEQVEVFEGKEVPDGFKVFGVVTTSCDTYNGATGLFEAKCNQDALMDVLKSRAADAGGGMLVEPSCGERTLEKSLERVDTRGGATSPAAPGALPAPTTGGKINKRVRLECQASVARPLNGVMPKSLPPAQPSALSSAGPAKPDGERVRIGDVDVSIRAERDAAAPPQEPRPVEELGDMEHTPEGYPRIGTVSAECQSGCSIGAARRALKHAAAKLGAIAVAESTCEPVSDRWRCQGVAIGEGK